MKLIIEQDQSKRYAGLTIIEGALLPYQINRIYESGPSADFAEYKEKADIDLQKFLFKFPKRARWNIPPTPCLFAGETRLTPRVMQIVQERNKEVELLEYPKRSSAGGLDSPSPIDQDSGFSSL